MKQDIWMLVGFIVIVAFLALYFKLPICDRMAKDLTPNQLKECGL